MSYKLGIIALIALHACVASAVPACCSCTRNLRPVCGSDGQTYGNGCLLNCQKHKTNSDLTIVKDGACEGDAQSCSCTQDYQPVCGNDGNTYPNRCVLVCTRSSNPDIDVVSEGECDKVKIAEVPCTCTDDLREVCGSDGNTYANDCLLNCATAKDSTLKIAHQGKCDDSIKVANPVIPTPIPCTCTFELKEVCGSDKVTYPNDCMLNCATANDSSLKIEYYGKCDHSVKVAESAGPAQCTCPKDLKPVCGTDGITYNNECLLKCAGSNVQLSRRAPCDV